MNPSLWIILLKASNKVLYTLGYMKSSIIQFEGYIFISTASISIKYILRMQLCTLRSLWATNRVRITSNGKETIVATPVAILPQRKLGILFRVVDKVVCDISFDISSYVTNWNRIKIIWFVILVTWFSNLWKIHEIPTCVIP